MGMDMKLGDVAQIRLVNYPYPEISGCFRMRWTNQ